MNPFSRHGITHLSPSNINCYADEPAAWVHTYLLKYKDKGGPAMWRGSAVEAGVDCFLHSNDVEKAIVVALARFEQDAMGVIDEEHDKERKAIPDFVRMACLGFKGVGLPDARQLKIEHSIEGIEVPIIGYVDYLWETLGRELKTTLRMPSAISPAHARQAGFYSVAKKRPFELVYVTPKRVEIFKLAEPEEAYRDFIRHVFAIRRLLALSSDPQEIAGIFVPDYTHYRWKSEAARSAAQAVWN